MSLPTKCECCGESFGNGEFYKISSGTTQGGLSVMTQEMGSDHYFDSKQCLIDYLNDKCK